MKNVNWLAANMCAPLGAMLSKKASAGIKILISNIQPDLQDIFKKNGFGERMGLNTVDDTYGTTIQYNRFDIGDKESLESYIAAHFRSGSRGLPKMSDALLKEFRRSIYEIFTNAADHSETALGIYACGQYFPRRNRLDFSIADLGIGIRTRIKRSKDIDLTPADAIKWAMSGNTTRTDRVGGLGLTLIKEFITLNRGRIVIVSDKGYWEYSKNNESSSEFKIPFEGTVVTIEINTADKASYCLKSEISPEDVF